MIGCDPELGVEREESPIVSLLRLRAGEELAYQQVLEKHGRNILEKIDDYCQSRKSKPNSPDYLFCKIEKGDKGGEEHFMLYSVVSFHFEKGFLDFEALKDFLEEFQYSNSQEIDTLKPYGEEILGSILDRRKQTRREFPQLLGVYYKGDQSDQVALMIRVNTEDFKGFSYFDAVKVLYNSSC